MNSMAQKKPEIQTISLTAPKNIRVDGKANEWNDSFAADNKRVSVLYSLANDDKNLYLIIKAIGAGTINKILAGGITFNINSSGKKTDKDAFSITYPLVKKTIRVQSGQNQVRPSAGSAYAQTSKDLTIAQKDSVAIIQHKAKLATVKEIKIAGFKNIADSLISIYNEYGLVARTAMDTKGALIYELAIPLELLSISITEPKEFAYQIKVNGITMADIPVSSITSVSIDKSGGGPGVMSVQMNGGQNYQDMISPTDFWGKYTTIKK